ncbi:carboxylate--amine ligase [Methanofollis ethanolicus]|uniref:carboxylate--amine ligase n=1 Tax=Methanofollis ethanolicus TaxID=488124 RepID=UPI00128F18E2|nr:hypothetical protein [Methanofollis ethanolicus]
MKKERCALVMGGYVNGYSIIQELYDRGVRDIVLLDHDRKPGAYSNKITRFICARATEESVHAELTELGKEYGQVVVYPTDDVHLEVLDALAGKVGSFCFLPINPANLGLCLNKYHQYRCCEALGVPYPKTVPIERVEDAGRILSVPFPVIVKPDKREDLKSDVFRNIVISDRGDYDTQLPRIIAALEQGVPLLASEVVPGDGSNIYAYVGYRSRDGRILNEWTGKKLSQYPDNFGIFASASNQAPPEVLEQGRRLLDGMDIVGIAEPEFKYDARDGRYKLMEINLRSMMWHRVGNISGVNVQYAQYLDAAGLDVPVQVQEKEREIHLVYLKHEIINLLTRPGYHRTFFRNLSGPVSLAFFDRHDLRPFLVDGADTVYEVGVACLKKLGLL